MANKNAIPPDNGFKDNPERINRSGRKKGSRNRSTIIREWLEVSQKIKNPITGETEELEQQDIMTLALIKKAREGDVSAFRELMDGAHGKVVQQIEQNTTINEKIDFSNISTEDLEKLLNEKE